MKTTLVIYTFMNGWFTSASTTTAEFPTAQTCYEAVAAVRLEKDQGFAYCVPAGTKINLPKTGG